MTSPRPALHLEREPLLAALRSAGPLPLQGGWALTSAMPHHEGGTLLVVTRADTRATLGLQLRLRQDDAPAWRRTPHLDLISHIPEDIGEPEGLAILSPLAERVATLDTPETSVHSPASEGDVAPPVEYPGLPPRWSTEAKSPFDFGRVYVLDLSSDCGQRCRFCSTRAKFSPQARFDADQTERLITGMRDARERGYEVLRLSGLDPLTHPDVHRLVAEGTALGFQHVHVYSPCTRLATAGEREALLAALGPTPRTFHVPLYGADAETHDGVTGVPGSFEAVTRALRGLLDAGQGDALTLVTVLTQDQLPRLEAFTAWLRDWALPVQVFLPFPTTRAEDDAFYDIATPQGSLVDALASAAPPMGLSELLPCIRFHHEVETGKPALSEGGFHPTTALMGTLFEHADYRRASDVSGNTYTIPVTRCPHASTCALARVCPKVVYTAYAKAFGLDELSPVTPEGLKALSVELFELMRPA